MSGLLRPGQSTLQGGLAKPPGLIEHIERKADRITLLCNDFGPRRVIRSRL